jgi:PAS domain S-box-containing protein
MTEKSKSRQELLNEIADLRDRLEETQETLRAIGSGEVDALVVTHSDTMQTLLLKGAYLPYSAMIESMGEGVLTLIPDGTIYFCNPRFAEIVQWPFEKLIGKRFLDLIPPEDQGEWAVMLKTSKKVITRREFSLQSEQTTYVPVQLTVRLLETEDIEAFIIVVTDLTERKLAEQAQREAEYKLIKMFQSMVDGIVVVDLSGEINYANPAAERILEIKKDEIIGKYFSSHEWKQIGANGEPYPPEQLPLAIALREQREVKALEHGISAPDGEIKWLSVNASPLVDESGQLFGAIASFRDVTEQERIAEALGKLHEQIAFQASLLDQVRNAVIATDLDGKIVYWNKFAGTLYQWTAEDAIGKSIFEVIVPEGHVGLAEEILQSLQQIGYWEGEFNVRRKDGSIFPAHVSDTLIKDAQGAASGIIGVSIDISERIQAEEAVRTSERLYRSLFENMLEGFAYHKMLYENNLPQDYIFLEVNKRFGQLTGLKNVAGKKISEVLPGIQSTNSDLIEIYGRVAITGKPERFESYIEQLGKWFSISVYSPEKEYFVSVFDNITERKQAEETLRDSEVRYRRLFEAAQDGVLLLDAETGEIFDVNPYLVRMLGYSYEEFMGKKLWEIGSFKDIVSSQLAYLELRKNDYIRYEDLPFGRKMDSSSMLNLSAMSIVLTINRLFSAMYVTYQSENRRRKKFAHAPKN